MTIRELATELGLSKTTVAAALRGNPAIKASTREWVQQRARELGYTQNPVASAFLQQVRSRGTVRCHANLALLSPPVGISRARSALFQAISDRAGELGYTVDRINIEDHDAATLTRILVARGVLGVIIAPMTDCLNELTLDWSKFATIAFGYSLSRPALHRVVPNHVEGLRTAFRECQKKGFRRIGLAIHEESDARSNGLWSSCFLGLQQRLPKGEQVRPFLASSDGYTADNIRKWIRREKTDAVIFPYRALAHRLLETIHELPDCVYPVVLDRLPNDPFAGIDQQYGHCGAQLADLLSLQIRRDERGIPAHPTITMVDGIWSDPTAVQPPIVQAIAPVGS